MADGTAIQWTDATCDPVRGWTKITHGCNNFYAARGTAESKRPGSALRARDLFEHNPFLTANELFERAGLSPVVVNATLADLERFGVVEKSHQPPPRSRVQIPALSRRSQRGRQALAISQLTASHA